MLYVPQALIYTADEPNKNTEREEERTISTNRTKETNRKKNLFFCALFLFCYLRERKEKWNRK
jgi:hypothetical protein